MHIANIPMATSKAFVPCELEVTGASAAFNFDGRVVSSAVGVWLGGAKMPVVDVVVAVGGGVVDALSLFVSAADVVMAVLGSVNDVVVVAASVVVVDEALLGIPCGTTIMWSCTTHVLVSLSNCASITISFE